MSVAAEDVFRTSDERKREVRRCADSLGEGAALAARCVTGSFIANCSASASCPSDIRLH